MSLIYSRRSVSVKKGKESSFMRKKKARRKYTHFIKNRRIKIGSHITKLC